MTVLSRREHLAISGDILVVMTGQRGVPGTLWVEAGMLAGVSPLQQRINQPHTSLVLTLRNPAVEERQSGQAWPPASKNNRDD